MKRVCSFLLFLFCVCAAESFGQIDTASIEGRVSDTSGASIVGAAVEVTNVETNYTYHATSNRDGEWSISPVHIGIYRVTVSASGFQKSVVNPVTLDVQQRQRVDVALQPGSVTSTVEVTGAASLLETDTVERSHLIDSQTMVTLPLNGRNPVQLAQLTVGVTTSEPGARDSNGYGFSANGSRSLQNNFLLDGIDNNSNLPDLLNEANYVIMPSVDALSEFRVETNSYSAEFGRATGAVVNATVKSGTNKFHGVVYEFLRNQDFDAENYFDTTQPSYHQNQFGATLGGPILRDKLFFFIDYEGLRLSQGQTYTAVVPTAAQRAGDMSSQLDLTSPTGALDCNGRPTYAGELFDTTQTQVSSSSPTGYCGVPFGYAADGVTPSNVIPAAKLDPLGLTLAALFPAPNASGLGYNYLSNPNLSKDRNQGDVRVDQVFSSSDSAFYRFSMGRQPATIPSPFPGLADGGGFFTGIENNNAYSVAISETHIFSPSLVNEARLGFNRLHTSRFQFNYNSDVSAQVGFPGVPFVSGTNNGGLPQLTFNDMATIGSPTYLPSNEIQNTYSFSDTVTFVRGNHSIKVGGSFRPEEFTILQPAASRGSMYFTTQFTDNPGDEGTGGSGFATMLTGQPNGGTINNINNIDYRRKVYAAFVQDSWRALPKLTVSMGLRYEFFSAITERHNAQSNFNSITGVLDIPTSSNVSLTPTLAAELPVNHTASNSLIPAPSLDFGPRVGLAYQFSPRWVFRSAFGIFFNGDENGPYSNPSPGFNPPYFNTENFVAPCSLSSYNPDAGSCAISGLSQLSQGFPANSLVDPNTPSLFSESKLSTPYVDQWHASLQYELGEKTIVEAAYVGSKGTKLYTNSNLNQAAPSADPSAPTAPRRPFPYVDSYVAWLQSNGFSNYNALQLRFQHRFSSGLSALINYTYSHALGDSSNANLGSQNNDSWRWSKHPEWEYGNLDFDNRHRMVASSWWDLPIGREQRFASNVNPVVDAVIGHWQLAGIVTLSSGTWYTVTDANANFANSDGQQRPDVVPGQKASGRPCLPGTYFNTCAFQDPAEGSFGNVGLNTLRGPGVENIDASILKTIPVGESRRFEIRGEFYNVFNHANFLFAAPGPQNSNNATVLGSSSFGYVTAANDPRLVQIGLKFYY
ncbi:MAG TPA: TonB-dependent receptor [Alloacidobacterium sp.]|nr:TonB-dependent receptor [Alloacidobacterium sp.]